jgi:hypothetical protein
MGLLDCIETIMADSKDKIAEAHANLLAQRAKIDEALRALEGIDPALEHARTGAAMPSEFAGLSVPDAGVKLLHITGHPMSSYEMSVELVKGGVPLTGQSPAGAVSWAMKRRSLISTDVVQVEGRKWALREWYTEKELQRIIENSADKAVADERSERTKKAVASAKARGVAWGRPRAITLERLIAFHTARALGQSIADACQSAGIALATYNLHKHNVNAWSPGDPWPPQNHVRLVKQ